GEMGASSASLRPQHCHAGVDLERDAADGAPGVGSEEKGGLGHLLGSRQIAEGRTFGAAAPALLVDDRAGAGGYDRARRESVDADIMGAELGGLLAGQRVDSALDGGIDGGILDRETDGDRGEVDNRSAAARDEMRRRGLERPENAFEA